jgi:hypothetical protein
MNEKQVQRRRDKTDLAVDVAKERELYETYGRRFGWDIHRIDHSEATQLVFTAKVMMHLDRAKRNFINPEIICGKVDSPVLIMGSEKSQQTIDGGWMAFTSRMTTMFGQDIGDDAMKVAWSNVSEVPPAQLKNRKAIILCGTSAKVQFEFMRKEVSADTEVIEIPHPSYLFRFNSEKVNVDRGNTLSLVKSIIKEYC